MKHLSLNRFLVFALLPVLLLLVAQSGGANEKLNYDLKPQRIAKDTYLFLGKNEGFSLDNGGNIANTAFIVTTDGVVVIDTGPSRLYGIQMLKAIRTVSKQPIKMVINTHHHPDHYFGNQAFTASDMVALASTRREMDAHAEAFSDNMYRMCGVWMQGTSPMTPRRSIQAGEFELGNHRFRLINLSGHSAGDLVIFDQTSGVLFAGDLVFNQRAPTTPHAYIPGWLNALNQLEKLDARLVVPGHGVPLKDKRAILATRDYLRWLDKVMKQGAEQGKDMSEMLQLAIPPVFQGLAEVRPEYQRSVAHLYPQYEQAQLIKIDVDDND